jgi:hypothetical protein
LRAHYELIEADETAGLSKSDQAELDMEPEEDFEGGENALEFLTSRHELEAAPSDLSLEEYR